MITESDRYVLLIASLPRFPGKFSSARQLPISRTDLDARLQWLDPADAACLERIETLTSWSRFKGQSEQAILDRCREIRASALNSALKQLIDRHLELRSLLWALRLRHTGLEPPKDFGYLQCCRWADEIKAHWLLDDFGLRHRLPWVLDVWKLLQSREFLELEKFLLELNWNDYAKLAERHHFDFTAVVIYVLRWKLLQRWLGYDGSQASARCERLADAALADYGAV